MNEAARIRPSLWYCLLGVPFLLIGGALFVYFLFHGLLHLTDTLTQVVVPGKTELKLEGGRTYTVFLEEHSVVHGKVYSTEAIGGLECRLSAMPSGTTVKIEQAGTNTTYSIGGRSGRSVLQFSIQKDGNYAFACDYGENSQGPEAVLAVGSGVGAAILRTVVESIAAVFAGGFLCVIVVLIVVIKRERARRVLTGNPPCRSGSET